MSIDMIIFILITVITIGLVAWDEYKDKKDEPRE